MITTLDSKAMDANSEALGVSVETLMNKAGQAIANTLKTRYLGKKIAFICGKGNNGGDGFAAANLLPRTNVAVFLLSSSSEIRSKEAKNQFSKLTCLVNKFIGSDLTQYDVVVDCALGTGVSGTLREPYSTYVDLINNFPGDIISIDVPSGFGTDKTVKPTLTITLHDVKEGMNTDNSGEIIIKDIGIPTDAFTKVGPGDMLRYPVPLKTSHKGCNGSLLVIGGGPYFGAPAMAAMAAMRTGTDLVRIATPSYSYASISSYSPVFMIKELKGDILEPDHVKKLLELSEISNAVLIGPGLGLNDITAEAVRNFVKDCNKPMVIDADGLNALGKNFNSNGKSVILTPHSREFLRLGGTIGNEPKTHVSIKATETGSVILLKGPADIISNGDRIRVNETGNPAMTSAGTGDVLSGIVAGLLAKGMSTFDAACLGAYISGKAGEYAFKKKSYGLIATDVIDKIPTVLSKGLR